MSEGDRVGDFQRYDVPTFAGSLTVIRAFGLLEDGTIRSPQQTTYRWNPGENQAKCHNEGQMVTNRRYDARTGYRREFLVRHRNIAETACSCGFYAYFRAVEAHRYLPTPISPGLLGIAEAYGRMTVGRDGLRASKMKIVGVIRRYGPKDMPVRPEEPIPPKPVFKYNIPLACIGTIFMLLSMFDPGQSWMSWIGWAGIAATWVVSWRYIIRSRRYLKAGQQFTEDMEEWKKAVSRLAFGNFMSAYSLTTSQVNKIKAKYPDVIVYETVEDAVKAHPLSSSADVPNDEKKDPFYLNDIYW